MCPSDRGRCACGDALLDGHLTCGKALCGTQAEAELRTRPTLKISDGDRFRRLFGFPPRLPSHPLASEGHVHPIASEGSGGPGSGDPGCSLCASGDHPTRDCPELRR